MTSFENLIEPGKIFAIHSSCPEKLKVQGSSFKVIGRPVAAAIAASFS